MLALYRCGCDAHLAGSRHKYMPREELDSASSLHAAPCVKVTLRCALSRRQARRHAALRKNLGPQHYHLCDSMC